MNFENLLVGGVGGFISWLCQKVVSRFFDKDMAEHQVRYSSVYAKQAEVISTLFSLIVETERVFTLFTSRGQIVWDESPEDQKQRQFIEMKQALFAVRDFYRKNRLYLPDSLCKLIDQMIEVFRDVDTTSDHFIEDHRNPRWSNVAYKELSEGFNKIVISPLPQIKSELERQFRGMLGITN